MELLNATDMLASYTMGTDKTGRESLVVVVKGTFTLPLNGSMPVLSEVQVPIVEADQFSGEPGFSAVTYESEYAPFKPRCDVLINGSACAAKGKQVSSLEVGIKLANITKVIQVIGNRFWFTGTGSIGVTSPQPFNKMPISYDVAFGGIDDAHPNPDKRDAFMANPFGKGLHRNLQNELVHNTPLPSTQERGKSVSYPDKDYKPMAFGPIGRAWPERAQYAGTYDQAWIDDVFPFLPADFDDRYFQSAPADQQCDYLQGGELVQLLNFTEQGKTTFTLPKIEVPLVYFRTKGDDEHLKAVIDTLIIEPDKGTFSLIWRSSLPLKKNIFEIPQILVGKKSKGWWRARTLGKTYYPSLAHIAKARESVDE